jgi:hypothetical protein
MNNPNTTRQNENGLRAFATLGQFLDADEWYPQRLGSAFVYRMGFAGRNGRVTCLATIFVSLEQFLFYVIAPTKAPETTRPAVADFITRANYGLRIGNLEMDFDDGEVRYKSGLNFAGESLTPEFIKNTIYPAVQTMDRFLPGLTSVMSGDKSALEAIAEIERNSELAGNLPGPGQ